MVFVSQAENEPDPVAQPDIVEALVSIESDFDARAPGPASVPLRQLVGE